MVAWRAHMDVQAEEDLQHEDADSIDSVDSTTTGSVDSGRSTASEARQPLFSAAAATFASKPSGNANWMLQGATDLPLLSRPGDVVNGHISIRQPLAGRPWPPLNLWALPLQSALYALSLSTRQALSDTDDLNIQQTGSLQDPSMSQMRLAARTMLHRRFHNELGLRGWSHQPLLTALEKTMSGLSYTKYISMPPYACYLRMVMANGGTSWHRLDDPWRASPARDLYAGWCTLLVHWPMVRFDVFSKNSSAGELHVANICFMPQPQFWNLAWPYDLAVTYLGPPQQPQCFPSHLCSNTTAGSPLGPWRAGTLAFDGGMALLPTVGATRIMLQHCTCRWSTKYPPAVMSARWGPWL